MSFKYFFPYKQSEGARNFCSETGKMVRNDNIFNGKLQRHDQM